MVVSDDPVRHADAAGDAVKNAIMLVAAQQNGGGQGPGPEFTNSLREAERKADEAHGHAMESKDGLKDTRKRLAAAERNAKDAMGVARHADQSALKYATAHEDLLRDLDTERRKRRDLEVQMVQQPGGAHTATNEVERRLKEAVDFSLGPWAKSRTYAWEFLSGQVRPRQSGDSSLSSLLPAFMRKTPNTDLQQVWDQLAQKDKWFQDQARQLAREDDAYQELCEKERELIWQAGLNEAAYGTGKLRIVLAGSALKEHQLHLLTLEQEVQKVLTDLALGHHPLRSADAQLVIPLPEVTEADSPRHSEPPEANPPLKERSATPSDTQSPQAVPEHIMEALRRAEAKAEAASVRAENAARDAQAAATGAQGSHLNATQASRASEDAARKAADEAANTNRKPPRASQVVHRDEAKKAAALDGPMGVLREHLRDHPDDEASKEAVALLERMQEIRSIRDRAGSPQEIFEHGFRRLIEKEGYGEMGKKAVDEIETQVQRELKSAMKGGGQIMNGLRDVMNEGLKKMCAISCCMVILMCSGAFALQLFNDEIKDITLT